MVQEHAPRLGMVAAAATFALVAVFGASLVVGFWVVFVEKGSVYRDLLDVRSGRRGGRGERGDDQGSDQGQDDATHGTGYLVPERVGFASGSTRSPGGHG